MGLYRLEFKVALLVEACSIDAAKIKTGIWSAAAKQMTMGVDMQPTESILAVDLKHSSSTVIIEDVTAVYEEKKRIAQREYPKEAQNLARAVTNYYIGEQMWFELFEHAKK